MCVYFVLFLYSKRHKKILKKILIGYDILNVMHIFGTQSGVPSQFLLQEELVLKCYDWFCNQHGVSFKSSWFQRKRPDLSFEVKLVKRVLFVCKNEAVLIDILSKPLCVIYMLPTIHTESKHEICANFCSGYSGSSP